MIRRITGKVVDAHPAYAVVDVGGVGYLVYITARTSCIVGEHVTLYTHLAVRENAMDLYGFLSQEELSFFALLLSLPKIGPKSAMQILSQADVTLLQQTVISQDPVHLNKMSGISKKTAEKIVFGLKDAFEGQLYETGSDAAIEGNTQGAFVSDTIDALITLGYPQSDARRAVQQLLATKPEVTKVNDAIKEVLKILG